MPAHIEGAYIELGPEYFEQALIRAGMPAELMPYDQVPETFAKDYMAVYDTLAEDDARHGNHTSITAQDIAEHMTTNESIGRGKKALVEKYASIMFANTTIESFDFTQHDHADPDAEDAFDIIADLDETGHVMQLIWNLRAQGKISEQQWQAATIRYGLSDNATDNLDTGCASYEQVGNTLVPNVGRQRASRLDHDFIATIRRALLSD